MDDALHAIANVVSDKTKHRASIALYRDGLVIATSALLPLRAMNFTILELCTIFLMRDRADPKSRYLLKIPAHLTKNCRRIPRFIPSQLTAAYDVYLDKIRPLFPGADLCTLLLIGNPGKGLSYQAFYRGYTRQIMRYAQVHMNPHKSRNAAGNAASEFTNGCLRHAKRPRSFLRCKNSLIEIKSETLLINRKIKISRDDFAFRLIGITSAMILLRR